LTRGIIGSLICTVGLLTVFATIGVFSSLIGSYVISLVPILDLIVGIVLCLMGLIIYFEINMPFISILITPSQRKGLLGFYSFGVLYGMAGVGCSAPIFLSIIFFAISRGPINSVLTFVLYAFGMGTPLIITSILLALAREQIIDKISALTPKLHKISGLVLFIAGIYLIYYYIVIS
jgi:cytochrome c-type biogenesis protein